VPLVFARIDSGLPPVIFGGDYDTADGTCVRDYVHVLDLAEAHLAVLDHIQAGSPQHHVFNVGTGRGYSVLEMVRKIAEIAEVHLDPEIRGRRLGDPATVVADPDRIRLNVHWQARLGLTDIVRSAWQSHLLLRGSEAQCGL
jgi:UDP-glucose 4-epimerase